MRIIGPPTGDRIAVLNRVMARQQVQPVFYDQVFPAVWYAGLDHDLDPVPMIAHCGHETGWGAFGRAVKPEMFNPAGLKVAYPNLVSGITDKDDHPLAHYQFLSWEHGALGYAQAICLYAGWFRHLNGMNCNPRRRFVEPKKLALENWEEFGNGNWNNRPDYAQPILQIARELQGR